MYKEIVYPDCELKFKYFIDDKGTIWSDRTQKIMATFTDKDGYQRVRLTMTNGKRRNFPVHRLVMTMFCPIDGMMDLQVNHKNGDKFNNSLENLEWCTCQENIEHAVRTHLRDDKGERNYFHKITEQDVREIRQLYATGNYTYRKLGKMFGLYEGHVSNIVRGLAWSHVK